MAGVPALWTRHDLCRRVLDDDLFQIPTLEAKPTYITLGDRPLIGSELVRHVRIP